MAFHRNWGPRRCQPDIPVVPTVLHTPHHLSSLLRVCLTTDKWLFMSVYIFKLSQEQQYLCCLHVLYIRTYIRVMFFMFE